MCCAIPFPVFEPASKDIAAITNANPAQITTTTDHNYVTGTIVRLDIPPGYGMTQANQLFSPIIVTSPTTFTMNLDTLFFDPFVIPVTPPQSLQVAQVIPIGEVNEILTAAVHNVL